MLLWLEQARSSRRWHQSGTIRVWEDFVFHPEIRAMECSTGGQDA